MPTAVRMGCCSPGRQLNRTQAGLDLLYSLTTGHSTQGIWELTCGMLAGELFPRLLSTAFCQGMFFLNPTAGSNDLFCTKVAGDVLPTRVGIPILLDLICCCLNGLFHVSP